jgi:hypothetical protein
MRKHNPQRPHTQPCWCCVLTYNTLSSCDRCIASLHTAPCTPKAPALPGRRGVPYKKPDNP